MSDENRSKLESSYKTKSTTISTDGITSSESESTVRWSLHWMPKFTPDQWRTFSERSDETWNPELGIDGGYDPERSKTLILSINPDAVFIVQPEGNTPN